uniref:Orotidine 5'-phosphate decarboxylase n=1 Tax=Nephromyces sp. MMRI TaxID=2496275 RepID=A0A3Q8UCH4_9APIC|nr:orotidine-5-phosphate decarboxylase [Nephromyces sp. MMRI]AZL94772.1 orotidine-5-phosphate decarboxylase [Nephromyces sp. MMRI]
MASFIEKLEKRAYNTPGGLLCVGIDPHIDTHMHTRPSEAQQDLYNRCVQLIQQTHTHAIAYKPNLAFFMASGLDGLSVLKKVCDYIPNDIPTLLDCKCGDIGSSSEMYVHSYYNILGVDGVTVHPYMGEDSIKPFIKHTNKGVFILSKTSNMGSNMSQHTTHAHTQLPLYLHIARTYKNIAQKAIEEGEQLACIGLVVGATAPHELKNVRKEWPNVWILSPGLGAQQADLYSTLKAGLREDGHGLILPISRGITQHQDARKAAEEWHTLINNTKQEILQETCAQTYAI